MDLDSPELTQYRSKLLQNKKFLKKIYTDFYKKLIQFGEVQDYILELGSGGGFIKELYPEAITSEIIPSPTVDIFCSGTQLPFRKGSFSKIVMINVLHHIPIVKLFFTEIARTLSFGGSLSMIEPTLTPFSNLIYSNFHHEPFIIDGGWEFTSNGPLSDANGALPWIVFFRDREFFITEFPELKIHSIIKHTPFKFILSGGLSRPQLVPNFLYGAIDYIDNFTIFKKYFSMFMTIHLIKN